MPYSYPHYVTLQDKSVLAERDDKIYDRSPWDAMSLIPLQDLKKIIQDNPTEIFWSPSGMIKSRILAPLNTMLRSHSHRSSFVVEINSLMMCLFGTPAALLGNGNGLDEPGIEGGREGGCAG